MNFKIDLRFTALRCNQPDETEEEPYLWTFFFQLDGGEYFLVSVVGIAGQGQEIQLGNKVVNFMGQAINLQPKEFSSEYNNCIGELDRRFSKSRKAGVKDLWDPHSRFRAYEEMIQTVDDMAAVRGLEETQVAVLKNAIANKLQVKVNQLVKI